MTRLVVSPQAYEPPRLAYLMLFRKPVSSNPHSENSPFVIV